MIVIVGVCMRMWVYACTVYCIRVHVHVNVIVCACECFFSGENQKGNAKKSPFCLAILMCVCLCLCVCVCVCMFDKVYEREKFEREGGDRKRDRDYRLQYMSVVHGKYNITTKFLTGVYWWKRTSNYSIYFSFGAHRILSFHSSVCNWKKTTCHLDFIWSDDILLVIIGSVCLSYCSECFRSDVYLFDVFIQI